MHTKLKVGFAGIYPFRPHFEHLEFLAHTLEDYGSEISYLSCDGSKNYCYAKILKNDNSRLQCTKCFLGGAHSYRNSNIYSIRKQISTINLSKDEIEHNLISSAASLNRTETDYELTGKESLECIKNLTKNFEYSFHSAVNWISKKKLNFVISFNGRMDMTRAVTYACEKLGIPYITCERTWFGDGLRLIPNANCLSIKALSQMMIQYNDKPLSYNQAVIASKLLSKRFTKQNSLEWRVYNNDAKKIVWPTKTSRERILILPSSRHEFAGHKEWATEWSSNTEALEAFIDAYNIHPNQLVLRCHPNWSEKIGKIYGTKSHEHYLKWAKKMGIKYIRSDENADTYSLIEQSDMVILNGGSSAVEAGACGKKVVCIGPATYQTASFCTTLKDFDSISRFNPSANNLSSDDIIRSTLRYVYLRAARFPQFVHYVKAQTTTHYSYFAGADPLRLINMARSGRILPDDSKVASDKNDENLILLMTKNKRWKDILSIKELEKGKKEPLYIKRRLLFKWVDQARNIFPRGDR